METTKLRGHHYNPSAWNDKGLAVVMRENVSHSACKIVLDIGKSRGLIKHGSLSKNREVFSLYNTLGKTLDPTCKGAKVICGSTTYTIRNICKWENQ